MLTAEQFQDNYRTEIERYDRFMRQQAKGHGMDERRFQEIRQKQADQSQYVNNMAAQAADMLVDAGVMPDFEIVEAVDSERRIGSFLSRRTETVVEAGDTVFQGWNVHLEPTGVSHYLIASRGLVRVFRDFKNHQVDKVPGIEEFPLDDDPKLFPIRPRKATDKKGNVIDIPRIENESDEEYAMRRYNHVINFNPRFDAAVNPKDAMSTSRIQNIQHGIIRTLRRKGLQ